MLTIILAADDGYHLDFLPIAATAWRRFFPEFKIALAVVGDSALSNEYIRFCKEYVDHIAIFDKSDAYPIASQTKVARLYLSTVFHDQVVSLHDIDFAPLQRGFYAGKYAQYEQGKILCMGKEVYRDNPHDKDKCPMSALTATSNLLHSIINPKDLVYTELFKSFLEYQCDSNDHKDLVSAPDFSDESLIRSLLKRWGKLELIKHIERGYDIWTDTIDRAKWEPDLHKLFLGGYYETHMHKVNTQWERDRCNIIARYVGCTEAWQNGKHWTDVSGKWQSIKVDAPDPNPYMSAL